MSLAHNHGCHRNSLGNSSSYFTRKHLAESVLILVLAVTTISANIKIKETRALSPHTQTVHIPKISHQKEEVRKNNYSLTLENQFIDCQLYMTTEPLQHPRSAKKHNPKDLVYLKTP